jgi:CHAT domain-containing protein/tetratricopeptide (TPR) repeat protein
MGRLRGLVLLVLPALAVLAAPARADEARWRKIILEARAAVEKKEPDIAERKFREALDDARSSKHAEERVAWSVVALGTFLVEERKQDEARPLFEEAFTLHARARLGRKLAASPDFERLLANGLLDENIHVSEAAALDRRVLSAYARALSERSAWEIADMLRRLIRLPDAQAAERLFQQALQVLERSPKTAAPAAAAAFRYLGFFYEEDETRYADEERARRKAVEILEPLGPSQDLATALLELGGLLDKNGRKEEAAREFQHSLQVAEAALGPEDGFVATVLYALADNFSARGLHEEARRLFDRKVKIDQKAAAQAAAAGRLEEASNLRGSIGVGYALQKRYSEAEPILRDVVRDKDARGDRYLPWYLRYLANAYKEEGRYSDAEPLYLRALDLQEKRVGGDTTEIWFALDDLSDLYRRQGRMADGLHYARRASGLLEKIFAEQDRGFARTILTEQRRRATVFEHHVELLGSSPDGGASESFRLAQLARATDTAEQLAQMAARFATADDGLGKKIRERQDVVRLARLNAEDLTREITKPVGKRDSHNEASLRRQAGVLEEKLQRVDRDLTREFPRYRQLTDVSPLPLEQVQALLRDDEAMLLFLVCKDDAFVWAVTRQHAAFAPVGANPGALSETVRKLRAQLDLGSTDQEALFGHPFAVEAAYGLQRALLGPVETTLRGITHLIVVPDGALQSLPFGVLVSAPPRAVPSLAALADKPEQAVQYRDVDWLIKHYAVTVLPSVSSLRALRTFAKTSPANAALVAFGDPLLSGDAASARGASLNKFFSRGAVADTTEIRKLQRLPESADELRSIAAALESPSSDLFLGAAATETRLKQLDLSRYRNVAFATHGLMAGDLKGVVEPALVLTPPEHGTKMDDGLLTASEIAQLRLNADWVILSACNTAASDGTPAAEGFSGLAKAFFYAGARALLVSHWSVSSDAAVKLTTMMIRDQHAGDDKARALQKSMLALMQNDERPYFAHPAFWAPFVVVGDGR